MQGRKVGLGIAENVNDSPGPAQAAGGGAATQMLKYDANLGSLEYSRELSGATGQMPRRSGQRLGRDRQRDLLGVLESEIIGASWTARPRAGRRASPGLTTAMS